MDTANAKCTERLPLRLIIKTMTADSYTCRVTCVCFCTLSAPESHRHPQTSPDGVHRALTAVLALVLQMHYLLSEKSLPPYLLATSSSQSKFSVMSMSG